jgi:hypothetical protein
MAMIALNDFFANAEADVSLLSEFKPDSMRSDLRVVLTMAGGNLSPRMREPEIVNSVWNSGAYEEHSSRVYGFQVRRAWPGDYNLMGSLTENNEPVTVRIEWFQHWGTAQQSRKTRTILIQQAHADLGSIKFAWGQ